MKKTIVLLNGKPFVATVDNGKVIEVDLTYLVDGETEKAA